MNVVEFVLAKRTSEDSSPWPTVNIRIDGKLLADIMKDIEMPMAAREGHPEIAGGYEAIGKPAVPEEYYLGVNPAWETEFRAAARSSPVGGRVLGLRPIRWFHFRQEAIPCRTFGVAR